MNDAIEKIARECLGLETLETRNSDALDFHELAAWTIREALERAYEMGRAEGGAAPQDDGFRRSRIRPAAAAEFQPGAEVLITYNPHVATATGVVGRVVDFKPGAGFMGCDLAKVEFTDPETGETHVLPFGTHNLSAGDRGALIARAEAHGEQAARLRALAEGLP